MMIRYIISILTWLFLSSAFLSAKPLNVSVRADSAILMNADTGAILYEKNAHKSQYPASIAKIATATYALKVRGNKLEKMIAAEHDSIAWISKEKVIRSNYTLPAHWIVPGTQHIGIKKGEELSLQDLLYGMMLPSGGDASNIIAQYIGGTIPTFMDLLNDYLKEIGCHNTTLKNPHGYYHPDQVTTAYDMALLTREALKNKTFRKIVKTVRYEKPQTNKQKPVTLIQTNRLVKRGKFYYPKAIGVKTGYTDYSQKTFVAAAEDGDRTLIAVLLKCEKRDHTFEDAIKLFESVFNEKKVRRKLLSAGPQKAMLSVDGASRAIKTYLEKDFTIDYFPAEEPKIKCLLQWDDVELPIEKNQRVGVLCVKDQDGKEILSKPLFALEDVGYSNMYRLKNFFGNKTWLMFVGGIATLFFLGGFLLRHRR